MSAKDWPMSADDWTIGLMSRLRWRIECHMVRMTDNGAAEPTVDMAKQAARVILSDEVARLQKECGDWVG